MFAASFHSPSVLQSSICFSFNNRGNSCKSIKEVAARPPLTVSNIGSDGHKGGQTSGRNENKKRRSFNGKKSKSSGQEEIIALFRRIRSEISKGDSKKTSKRSSNADKDNPSTESILDILDEPQTQVEDIAQFSAGKISTRKQDKDPTWRRVEHKNDHELPEYTHVLDLKLTRAPSNFVKKSPIPSLSTQKGKLAEVIDEALPSTVGNKLVQSATVEELKLAELKELAKSRGLKGYTKLNKGELIKLLKY